MKTLLLTITCFFLTCGSGFRVQAEPTFVDLAAFVINTRFRAYVPADASMGDCFAVLNKYGVCFSIYDLVDKSKKVTEEDFARVIGQSSLLFLGEAELVDGCIKRPDGIKNWVDYCSLNDIDCKRSWAEFARKD